jgi:hypothetical protein
LDWEAVGNPALQHEDHPPDNQQDLLRFRHLLKALERFRGQKTKAACWRRVSNAGNWWRLPSTQRRLNKR